MKYISGEDGVGSVDVTYLADMKYISGGGVGCSRCYLPG